MTSSEDQNQMPKNVAFHKDLRYMFKKKPSSGQKSILIKEW